MPPIRAPFPEQQRLHFKPGETEKFIQVKTRDQDTFPEAVEAFFLNLLAGNNAEIVLNHGVVRMKDNDTGSGDAGLSPISFANTFYYGLRVRGVRQDHPDQDRRGGCSHRGVPHPGPHGDQSDDYTGGTFIVSFAANEFVKTVEIPIKQDLIWEGTEQVRLTMRGFTGRPASAAPFVATLNILDDERLPEVHLLDPVITVTEGLDPKVVFRLHSVTQAFGIKVHFKTVDLTAFSPSDYTGITGTVDMQVVVDGGTDGVIEIPIKDDLLLEAPESFGLILTGIENGVLKHHSGTVVIRDNELDTVEGHRVPRRQRQRLPSTSTNAASRRSWCWSATLTTTSSTSPSPMWTADTRHRPPRAA
jgi:hypothetical protein